MFQIGQIISSSQLVRNFLRVSRYLKNNSEPILISQRSGEYLVVMQAESCDRLVLENMKAQGMQPEIVYLRDELLNKNL